MSCRRLLLALLLFSSWSSVHARSLGHEAVALSLAKLALTKAAPPAPSLPGPPYPLKAMEKGIQGTVVVAVQFDRAGNVDTCRIVRSSGSDILDDNTFDFIEQHWGSPRMAGKSLQTPITYKLPSAATAPKGLPGKISLEQLLRQQGFTWAPAVEGTDNANLVKVTINGKPFTLLIDTGADTTLLSYNSALLSGLSMSVVKAAPLFGITGAVAGKLHHVQVTRFEIGGKECNLTPVIAADIDEEYSNGKAYQGYLGIPFLKANHAVVVVNPPIVFLNPKQAASSALDSWMRAQGSMMVQLRYIQGHYQGPVKLDGIPTQMILDTGAHFSVVAQPFVAENNFESTRTPLKNTGINEEETDASAVKFNEIEMGGFPFGPETMTTGSTFQMKAKANDPSEEGLFGFDLLGRVSTVIDTSSDKVYFRQFGR